MIEVVVKGKFTGWHALAWFAALFGVMFAVNGIFLFQAITSFPGEDAPKSYLQGLNYNTQLAQKATQLESGIEAEIGLLEGRLIVRIIQMNGQGKQNYEITGTLRHRADTALDQTLTFNADGRDRFAADLGRSLSGSWTANIAAVDAKTGETLLKAQKPIYFR